MEYRALGGSGLKVSTLTLGTMTFGGKGKFGQIGSLGVDEIRRIIDLVADHGVNLIDTADIYSFGVCEELIGEATGGKLKPGMLIASKARFPMGSGPQRRRPFALSLDPGLRSEPEAAARRHDRPLSAS